MTNLRLCYQTIEFGKTDIHLCTLRNHQEFYDPQGVAEKLGISSAAWPIFGILWPSSLVLAHHILDYDTNTKRILEVGCGTALSSLLLNRKQADITATDHHPETQHFLDRNTTLNGDCPIPFERTGWADDNDSLGRFDLIIGSDLLYEDEHIELLAEFIGSHSKPQCEVIIVDPGRGRKNKLAKRLIEFGYVLSTSKPTNTDYLNSEFKGHILEFTRTL
ncbi:class I SAM-dependent methyltransferase [Echinimonas agarilytica]|uniref:Protein N-lysine methyltransferase family protein n=1 Tax=Echinimonas agarilytica TaxID=1215918 RepID=A0AA42B8Q9_9GAMM|nr:protein N-lysine methyltransferase family protein [Echinimonas agarilytica]MCM2681127.1 protein N-lysine methyltransferase family protein [Echinimonas agarilytica]